MDPTTLLIAAFVMLVVSYGITALTTKKQEGAKPNAITDFQFPQTDEGMPQAVIFGDVWTPDYQILWYGNFRTSEIHAKSAGKKG